MRDPDTISKKLFSDRPEIERLVTRLESKQAQRNVTKLHKNTMKSSEEQIARVKIVSQDKDAVIVIFSTST